MSYRFERDESIPGASRRIACEQLERALAALADPDELGAEETIHDVRKRCKKLRGLVRLVRPGLGDEYDHANAAFRDAARELSPLRDAHALQGTFGDLVEAESGQQPRGTAAVMRALEEQAADASRGLREGDERLARAAALLEGARARIDGWPLDDDPDVLEAGIAKTYRRARNAFRASLEAPSTATLHEWRKRVKYGWYHARLLRDSAPSVLGPLAKRFHDLSGALGDDHDLAVFVEALREEPDRYGGDVEAPILLAEARRSDLRDRAQRLGARLYVEPPGAYAQRLVAYRAAWILHGDENAVGEIAALAPD